MLYPSLCQMAARQMSTIAERNATRSLEADSGELRSFACIFCPILSLIMPLVFGFTVTGTSCRILTPLCRLLVRIRCLCGRPSLF